LRALEISILPIKAQSKLLGAYQPGKVVLTSYTGVLLQIISLSIAIEYTNDLKVDPGCNFEVVIFTFQLFASSK
jgi:hypothetical protein